MMMIIIIISIIIIMFKEEVKIRKMNSINSNFLCDLCLGCVLVFIYLYLHYNKGNTIRQMS